MTVSPVEEAEIPALNADDARSLTEQIKSGIEEIWLLIMRAYTERAWVALDYKSWDEYCTCEFSGARLRLPREERTEVIASMRDIGMSVRAISSATGIGRGTVQRQLSGVPNGTPEPLSGTPGGLTANTPGQTPAVEAALAKARASAKSSDEPAADGQYALLDIVDGSATTTVTGTDGKSYSKAKATRRPYRRSLASTARKLAADLRLAYEKLQKLIDDDRFESERDEILTHLRTEMAAGRELFSQLDSDGA